MGRAKRAKSPVFKRTVFRNGLTLLTEKQANLQSLSIGVWVKVGTRHERSHEAGASHFLEHMLFKGTETRTALEITRAVEQVGGEFNAFTGREYTCFHVTLLARDLPLAAEILCDIILNSNFDPVEFEREKKVILQEIAMVEEAPEELAGDIHVERIFGQHGLGKPITGTERSMRQMKRGDLLRFFRKHYVPENLVISVVGNVRHAQVTAALRPLTRGRWAGRPEPVHAHDRLPTMPEARFGVPKMRDGFWWDIRPTEQVHVMWGVAGPQYASKDRMIALVLNAFLGGGMSSELFQEIREKNALAYTVYSSHSPFVDAGVFTIYAATAPHQVAFCIKLIEECVGKLMRELLSEDELNTVKSSLKGTLLLSSDSVESRMLSIATNEICLHEYLSPDDLCRAIDEVTPQQIRRVARKLFSNFRRSIVVIGPRPTASMRKRLRTITGMNVRVKK